MTAAGRRHPHGFGARGRRVAVADDARRRGTAADVGTVVPVRSPRLTVVAYEQRAAGIDAPTLVPPAVAIHWADRIRRAPSALPPGVGHATAPQAPALFAQHVVRFLRLGRKVPE